MTNKLNKLCHGFLMMLVGISLICATRVYAQDDYHYTENQHAQPSILAKTADFVIARPLLFVTTALGTAVFVVTLPITAAADSAEDAAEFFVKSPARATFERCLGCALDSGFSEDL
ncbi:MAG: hypothetical protein Tsb005_21010 [Gammaproteobacteria bacterium]